MAAMPRKASHELGLTQARNLHLAAQGLLTAPTRAATPLTLRRCIERGKNDHAQQRKHLDKLLAHIRDAGPVKSSDFERPDEHKGKGGGWWGWKEEKRWLEALFARGELMVARRENFHRVYDLPE